MTNEEILTLLTFITTYLFGFIAKKVKFINDNLIPIQNIFIGLVFAIIEYCITKDFKISIAVSGLLAGGTYDIFHNIEKIKKDK